MILELGKKYRTFDGESATVIHIVDEPLMDSYKVIAVKGKYEVVVTYNIKGEWCDYKYHDNNIKEEIK